MSFLDGIQKFIHGSVNSAFRTNPNYAKAQDETLKAVNYARMAAVAGVVIGVALTALALTSCFLLAAPLILISVPMSFFSYNSYHMLGNYTDILTLPTKYMSLFENGYDKTKVREQLKKNTIFFDPFVEMAADNFVKRPDQF